MNKRIISIILVICLAAAMLAACGSKNAIDSDKATQIALKDMGISEAEATEIHAHIGDYNGTPVYSIYISYNGAQTEYIISVYGDILFTGAGSHSH